MPNHITNILEVEGPQATIDKFFESVKSVEEGHSRDFDFNKIVPQPDNLFTEALSLEKERELEKQGLPNWYNWNCDNWGTKWNCYDIYLNVNGVQFDTAWSTPFPVIEAASKQWSDLTFKMQYADEDIGYNCGWYHLKGGEIIEQKDYKYPEEYDEGLRYAIKIKGYEVYKIIGTGEDTRVFWEEEDYQEFLKEQN